MAAYYAQFFSSPPLYLSLRHDQTGVVCRSVDIHAKPSRYASEEGRRAASEEQISASEGLKCI